MSNFDHLVDTNIIKDNRNNLFYFDFEDEKMDKMFECSFLSI